MNKFGSDEQVTVELPEKENTETTEPSDFWREHKYVVLNSIMDHNMLAFMKSYLFLKYQVNQMVKDHQCPDSYSFYGDLAFDTLLGTLAKPIGDIIGEELLPTYSYGRIYMPGDDLKIHRDRPECEVSVTLSIAYSGDDKQSPPNPIYFSDNKDKTEAAELSLYPGDACIYSGCELWHWRDKITHEWIMQVFLHYVRANGPYKNKAYDGRSGLGLKK